MHILRFVADNWDDILVVLVLIAAAITGITRWIKVKGPIFNENHETGWEGLGFSAVCPLAESAAEDPA